MFIVACFSREARNTSATSEKAKRLAKSNRCDRSVTKETMAAVTPTTNQKRAAIGSVQNNRASIALSDASVLATAITCRVTAPGMATPLAPAPDFSGRRARHTTVIFVSIGLGRKSWMALGRSHQVTLGSRKRSHVHFCHQTAAIKATAASPGEATRRRSDPCLN